MKFLVTTSIQVGYKNILEEYPTIIDFNTLPYKESVDGFEYMTVEIDNLQDLLSLQSRLGESIIIGDVNGFDVKNIKKQMLIYDGYIE